MRGRTSFAAAALALAALVAAPARAAGADPAGRVVLDFEDPAEVGALRAGSDHVSLELAEGSGVTGGRSCLRVVGRMGEPWASLVLADPVRLAAFADYDCVGLDVCSERDAAIGLTLELWDAASRDYATRATLETKRVHRGTNTLFWAIDRARRNAREGLEWSQLEPADKIDRARLTKVKLFFTPLAEGGDTALRLDRLRLLPANAAGGTLEIALPAGAIGFKFGSPFSCPGGFRSVATGDAPDCVGTGIVEVGKDWPDSLTGNGLYSPRGEFAFRASVTAGAYRVWISAGRILGRDPPGQPFLLSVGGVRLVDEALTERELLGEKGLFRYYRTQYSERPDALWLDYALPEAEEFTGTVAVAQPPLEVRVNGMRLSAMVLVPAGDEAGFRKLCADIRAARLARFHARTFVERRPGPAKPAGAGACALWEPAPGEAVRPWSAPPAAGPTAALEWRAARGERLARPVCVTAWEDLGTGDLEVSDFEGPARIPASAVRRYHMNYRVRDSTVGEMALLPWTRIRFEAGITWAYWLWLKVPDDAPPGAYAATLTFRPDRGGAQRVAVGLTVLPFRLEDPLPVAFGMYYAPWDLALREAPPGYADAAGFALALTRAQFAFMREIGFTSVSLPAPAVHRGSLRTAGVQPVWDAARAAGFGRTPEQPLMTSQLGLARRVAREMFDELDPARYGPGYVDRNPGAELALPGFGERLRGVLAPYKAWLDAAGLPVAVEVVDEPREMPNPWNRRRDEAIRYADWLREIGFTTFVTLMADENGGKDYTPLADHVDIVSVHAWDKARRLIDKARAGGKTLWYYNTGMDRLSWGFYSWAMGAKGRWEWHFCFPEPDGADGHPNPGEWYTPFTAMDGYAPHAPYFDVPGGMAFKSAFFAVADGIADYAYLRTLETAIVAAAGDPARAQAVEDARAFLGAVRKAVPEYPGVVGMADPEAGARVGAGLDTPAAAMTDRWRARAADLIIALTRAGPQAGGGQRGQTHPPSSR